MNSRVKNLLAQASPKLKVAGGTAALCLLVSACWVFGQTAYKNADQVLNAVFNSTNSTLQVQFLSSSADPCLNPGAAKSSAAMNIGSATTTQLVALQSGQTVYVCNTSFSYSVAGSAQFEYGTGTNCGTGTTTLTGAIVTTANEFLSIGWGGTVFKAASSNALCVVTTGTSPSMQGVLTYVQQ